jgi:hypothetical protein
VHELSFATDPLGRIDGEAALRKTRRESYIGISTFAIPTKGYLVKQYCHIDRFGGYDSKKLILPVEAKGFMQKSQSASAPGALQRDEDATREETIRPRINADKRQDKIFPD